MPFQQKTQGIKKPWVRHGYQKNLKRYTYNGKNPTEACRVLKHRFIQTTNIAVSFRYKFYLIHDPVYDGNAYAAFFPDPDVFFNIRLFVIGTLERNTVVRNLDQQLFVYA